MKKTLLAALAIAGFAVATSAQAQTPAAAANRSLFLGFQATGGVGSATNIVVNIGLPNDLSTLNLDINSALSSTYGSNWYSRSDLYFGVIGAAFTEVPGVDIQSTLYSSVATGSEAPARDTGSSQAIVKNKISAFRSQYTSNLNNEQTIGSAVYMVNGGVDTYTWSSYNPSTQAFDYFGNITTLINESLDIYRVVPSVPLAGDPGELYSTGLYISAQGQAVPEPSTYVLFGLGALLLIIAYRRKANA
jgi:hypothetical protein